MLSWETTSTILGHQNAASVRTRGRFRSLGLSPCEHTGLMGWALDVRGCGHHAPWKRSKTGQVCCVSHWASSCSTWREHSHFLNKWKKTRQGSEFDSQLISNGFCILTSRSFISALTPEGHVFTSWSRSPWHMAPFQERPPLLPELRREEFWPPKIKIIQVLQQILNNHSCFLPD